MVLRASGAPATCPDSLPEATHVVTFLTAPLRPLADVLDLTSEAVVALGTLSVGALSLLLASDDDDYPPLHSVERPRS